MDIEEIVIARSINCATIPEKFQSGQGVGEEAGC